MGFKKPNDLSGIACTTVYPKCIIWNLPGIKCLGIQTGDTLDEITFAIAKKLCEISQPIDLSTVSAQCLVDKLGATIPLNKTIANYLQLIIDNECKLADLIVAIQNQLNSLNPSLTLNLRCLTPFDPSGNPLAYNVQSVLQILINEACAIRDAITGLNGAITAVNIRIDNLPTPYTEPSIVNSCLYIGSRPLNQAFTILASDYCTYKTNLGTISDIQTAISRQCSGLNTFFNSNANFIQSPDSLADTINNQWITICNLLSRMTALEACACKFTCNDIQIGFSATFNDDNTVTLNFTSGAGTFIPAGFIDCGSILTIKNDNGITTLPINVIVSQNGTSIDVDISMFEQGDYLTFDLNSKLCKGDIHCDKCTSRVVRNTSGCCLITNTGAASISITYKICGIPAGS